MTIIYGASLSPFVRKVLAVAAEKGIAINHQPIGLGSKDPDFRAASPFGKIPALRDGDFTLADSSAIVHYWEALHPSPALLPADPQLRGRVVWFDECADTVLVPVFAKLFFNRVVAPRFMKRPGDLAAAEKAEADEVPPLVDWLEAQLPATAWLLGDAITLADIAMASPFVNLAHAGWQLDAARWPGVAAWLGRVLARPSLAGLVAAEQRMLAA
ncbi:MAG: glutathione S-transferase family protein [Sphingomonadales bacterium]|jgi:glutathione S-transferase